MNNLDKAMIEYGRQVNRELDEFAAWARTPAREPPRTTWGHVLIGIGLVAIAVAEFVFFFG